MSGKQNEPAAPVQAGAGVGAKGQLKVTVYPWGVDFELPREGAT